MLGNEMSIRLAYCHLMESTYTKETYSKLACMLGLRKRSSPLYGFVLAID